LYTLAGLITTNIYCLWKNKLFNINEFHSDTFCFDALEEFVYKICGSGLPNVYESTDFLVEYI